MRRQYQLWTTQVASACSTRLRTVVLSAGGRPVHAGPARASHRAGPPDRPPARRRPRAPPPGLPRHAGSVHPRPAPGRAGLRRRRGPPAGGRRGPSWARCATTPTRVPSSSAARATSAHLRRGRRASDGPARHHPGRARACRCSPARPPRCCSPGRSPTGCTAGCRARVHRHRAVGVRRRGWAQSVGEREPGVASVSGAGALGADPAGRVIAAVSPARSRGPIERADRSRRLFSRAGCTRRTVGRAARVAGRQQAHRGVTPVAAQTSVTRRLSRRPSNSRRPDRSMRPPGRLS
jgi:hypothetical protein